MHKRILVSAAADADLDAMANDIAVDSGIDMGTKFYTAFHETLQMLSEMPEMGRIRFFDSS